MRNVSTIGEALDKGFTRYFTGKPCKRGHVCERNLQRQCVECRRIHKRSSGKGYRERNRDAIKLKRKQYNAANKSKSREYAREWRKRNQLAGFARLTLQRIEKCTGQRVLNKSAADSGYTQEQYISHIESLWLKGMSWDNRSDWHVDHIKPIAAFIREGVTDISIINSLENLQPLWAIDNLKKGDSY